MGSVTSPFVQAVADSLQFDSLSKDAAEGLAPHLEVRLREIIQDALKFMRRSKRHTLSPDDINSALIAKNKEVSTPQRAVESIKGTLHVVACAMRLRAQHQLSDGPETGTWF